MRHHDQACCDQPGMHTTALMGHVACMFASESVKHGDPSRLYGGDRTDHFNLATKSCDQKGVAQAEADVHECPSCMTAGIVSLVHMTPDCVPVFVCLFRAKHEGTAHLTGHARS